MAAGAATAAADEGGDDSSDEATNSSTAGSAVISEKVAPHFSIEAASLLMHARMAAAVDSAPSSCATAARLPLSACIPACATRRRIRICHR